MFCIPKIIHGTKILFLTNFLTFWQPPLSAAHIPYADISPYMGKVSGFLVLGVLRLWRREVVLFFIVLLF
jgi:hypothetical protein